MRQSHFIERNDAQWRELEHFLNVLDSSKSAGLPFPVDEFDRRYRRICQHLAIAAERGYSRGLQGRLHGLVMRAHQHFYGIQKRPWRAAARFLLDDYPRLVRREWRLLALSAALFMAPLLGLLAAAQFQPELVYTVADNSALNDAESMYDPSLDKLGRDRDAQTDFQMFGFYIYNNTSIGFRTFVGGLLFGLGTIFFLLFNGLYIGAIAGHLTALGYIETFWGFVAGHSAFELTAIMLSGAAGLKVGLALIAPAARTRRLALREAMGTGVKLMYGAVALFFAAAFVEAFWSSIGTIASLTKYLVGGMGWILVGAYFLASGITHSGYRPLTDINRET
ncbi:MAG: stage II sporulation protein M [Gammaproteobacteria bacterium]|nr:stage II sporulation protein M [Gammaproteobacteria bacterium]